MSKEILGKKLNPGQRAHIVGGVAENVSVLTSNVGNVSKIQNLKDIAGGLGASLSGSFLVAGGLFTMVKGYKMLRNASGLRIGDGDIADAVEQAGVSLSKQEIRGLQKELTQELYAEGVCNKKGFVTSASRQEGIDVSNNIARAVEKVFARYKTSKNPDFVTDITKSFALDLGFTCKETSNGLVFAPYKGQKGVETSLFEAKDLLGPNHKKAKVFTEILELSGIIRDDKCVKDPEITDLKGCFAAAGIEYSEESLNAAKSYFANKSKAVAVVPSYHNNVNAKQKIEASFVSFVGGSLAIIGVMALLATFSGIGLFAAASFGVGIGGIGLASSLVLRDIKNEGVETKNYNNLRIEHKKLKEQAISPEEKLEHAMQEKLYAARSNEKAGSTLANTMYVSSLAIALLVVMSVIAPVGLGMLALAVMTPFAVGSVTMVASKRVYGTEAGNISNEIMEYKAILHDKAKGDLTPDQAQRLSELGEKYAGKEDIKISDKGFVEFVNPIHNAKFHKRQNGKNYASIPTEESGRLIGSEDLSQIAGELRSAGVDVECAVKDKATSKKPTSVLSGQERETDSLVMH